MSRTITFVTGNANKLKEVQAILATAKHINLVSHKLDLPELQAATAREVAMDKCRRAAEILGGPVLTEVMTQT
jgi:inosine triphosphate pyrophosphatase